MPCKPVPHAAVTLAHDNGRLEFTVIDDGKDFDATSTHYASNDSATLLTNCSTRASAPALQPRAAR